MARASLLVLNTWKKHEAPIVRLIGQVVDPQLARQTGAISPSRLKLLLEDAQELAPERQKVTRVKDQ